MRDSKTGKGWAPTIRCPSRPVPGVVRPTTKLGVPLTPGLHALGHVAVDVGLVPVGVDAGR